MSTWAKMGMAENKQDTVAKMLKLLPKTGFYKPMGDTVASPIFYVQFVVKS